MSSTPLERAFAVFCDSIFPLIVPDQQALFKDLAVNFIEENLKKKKATVDKNKEEEVKDLISNSFVDTELEEFYPEKVDYFSIPTCIDSLKKLILTEKRGNQRLLISYINQGKVLCKLKTLIKCSFVKFIKCLNDEHQIYFSRTYVSFLIKLYRLSLEFPKLNTSTLSIHFVKKHLNQIEDFLTNEKEKRLLESSDEIWGKRTGVTQEIDELNL